MGAWNVMSYGWPYITKEIPQYLITMTMDRVRGAKAAQTHNQTGKIKRDSYVSFIEDADIREHFLHIAKKVNQDGGWGFDIDAIEPLQYGEYPIGGEYGWHQDAHTEPYKDGRVRKMSFSVFLNDTFEGGEFDLEIYSPAVKDRYETFHSLPDTALFFKSDQWHRVRPITNGIRRSLVGWVLGSKWK
jgi:PKHD-type hydroxylase